MQAFAALTALAAPIGPHAQLAKSAVYSEDTSVSGHLDWLAPDGLLAAGTSMGSPAFQAGRPDACADRACQLMDKLQALQLADPDSLLLLHGSLQLWVANLPRGSQWQFVGQAVQRAKKRQWTACLPPWVCPARRDH
jgi:hypothetical protein